MLALAGLSCRALQRICRRLAMDNCPICLDDLDAASPVLPCGHRCHASCLGQLAEATGNAATRRGAVIACPSCRQESRVAAPTPVAAFDVGDAVLALWGHKWYPGVVDDVLDGGAAYEIAWDDGCCNDAAVVKYGLQGNGRFIINFPGESPLASVMAALPAAPEAVTAAAPRRSGRAPAPKVIVDPEAPTLQATIISRSKKRPHKRETGEWVGQTVEGATQKSNGKWKYPAMFPGREFDDLDELRAAKRQHAEQRAACVPARISRAFRVSGEKE